MELTIVVDGKNLTLKSTAATLLRYEAQTGRNFLATLAEIESSNGDYTSINLTMVFEIVWALAKTADPTIPEPLTWLDGFSEFPILNHMEMIMGVITKSIVTKNA